MFIITLTTILVCFTNVQSISYQGPSRIEVEAPFDFTTSNEYFIKVPESFTHSTGLSYDESVSVNWTPDLRNERVIWQIVARTLGWVGFGFSHNGGMKGADMITAWIKNGKLYLQDRHGIGNTIPPVDEIGNWQPLEAYENGTHTVITVARNINTCDEQDFALNDETTRIIYAWGADDPTGDDPPYHGPNRGVRSSYVLLPPNVQSDNHDQFKKWSIAQEFTLPRNRDTFYSCHIEKVPELPTKHHYVGYGINLGKNAHAHLHHVTLYECFVPNDVDSSQIFEKHVGQHPHECYTPNMPPDFNRCLRFMMVWVVGSEGYMLPSDVGIPMHDEHGGGSYLMFDVHYDNPSTLEDLQVEWSIDVYYTDQLRKYEAGTVFLGHALNIGLAIPPSQPHWLTVGHCAPECTRATIPETGVKAFEVLLHSHLLARSMRMRHFRDGNELPMIAQDRNYDFNFQQLRTLKEEVLILPGDQITVECDYDSTSRTNTTFSGFGTREEMCQAFILFYPKTELTWCQSSATVDTLSEAYDLHTIPRRQRLDDYVFTTELEDGTDYQMRINEINWTPERIKFANEKLANGTYFAKCFTGNGKKIKADSNDARYQTIPPYVPPVDKACESYYRVIDSFTSSASYTANVPSIISVSAMAVIGVNVLLHRG